MAQTAAFLLTYLLGAILTSVQSKPFEEYHITSQSFGYHPEVGKVMFHGGMNYEDEIDKVSHTMELRGRALQTNNYLKSAYCGTSLSTYKSLMYGSYYYEYVLANTCLDISVSGGGGYISFKLIASENSDGTLNASWNYYTDNACSSGIKTATTMTNQKQNTCVSNSAEVEYVSNIPDPTDGYFEGIYDTTSCSKLIYGEDYGIGWNQCITVSSTYVKYTGCGSEMSLTSYTGAGCTGSETTSTITTDTCSTRTDDDYSIDEDDTNIGQVTFPSASYDGTKYKCKIASNDNDDVCFAGSESLLLESGDHVSIENVKLGDRIQVAAFDGTLQYADVIVIPHEKNNRKTSFIELITADGSLKVTPSHLVMAGACDNSTNMELTRAVDIPLGSCMATSGGYSQVIATHITKGYGVYSVVTSHGDGLLLVNGFKASSFAINHAVVNAYYHLHRALFVVAPTLVKGMAPVSAVLGFLGVIISSI